LRKLASRRVLDSATSFLALYEIASTFLQNLFPCMLLPITQKEKQQTLIKFEIAL